MADERNDGKQVVGAPLATNDTGYMSAYFWNRTLTFYMPRVVIIQIWQLGLLNLVMQLAVIGWHCYILGNPKGWALFEIPVNRVTNAYVSGGAAAQSWATTSASLSSRYPYCGAHTGWDFIYNSEYNYSNVRCQPLNAFEVATKLPATAAVATVYLDVYEEGWDCSASDAATKASDCVANGGTNSILFGTQCMCTTRTTTYPVGIDAMTMNFAHAVCGQHAHRCLGLWAWSTCLTSSLPTRRLAGRRLASRRCVRDGSARGSNVPLLPVAGDHVFHDGQSAWIFGRD
jgi:hypothetical protein